MAMSVSDLVASRIRDARKRRGWSADQLAEQCARAGLPVTRSVLANIESGRKSADGTRRRDVTVDELLGLAAVLDVSPTYLLGLSRETGASPAVAVTSTTVITDPDLLTQWIRGDQPLPNGDARTYFSTALESRAVADPSRVIDELRRAVLQDRAKELADQFHASAQAVAEQAHAQVSAVIAEVGGALATGASVEDVLGLLRKASEELKHNDHPAES